MHIYSIKSYQGRNIYSHRPVIKMVIDIGTIYDTPTKDIQRFNERLLSMFPGLHEHYCSLGRKGGLVERLQEGTYIGHVTEHVILELQNILGYEVCYGKTRVIKEPSIYSIIYEYKNEKCAIECGKAAVSIASDLIENRDVQIKPILENLKAVSARAELGPSTKAIFEEAKKRGIPVSRMGNDSILRLGQGKYSRLIEASLTDYPSCIAVDIAGNKPLTKEILSNNGIPVPYGDMAYTEESAVMSAESIGYPVVVKPYDGNQGKGVTLNINNEQQVRSAFREAAKFSTAVIVERFIEGRDYRVLVIGDKVSAVSERKPPFVIGDGIHAVRQLVDLENRNTLRGEGHERPLTRIKLDAIAQQVLERQGLDVNYIPSAGEVVLLRDNSNLSTGGTARDCTNEIHPYNISLAVKAAKAIGLDIAGIDITAEDISVPIHHSNGAIIEVNAAPGLRMHLFPSEGEQNNVAGDILDMLFPKGQPSSIPIISITGTNGKTTTTRLVSHTLSLTGKTVGMTNTSGVYVNNKCVMKGDNTGPVSAGIVLSDRRVEAAVLETARGGIVQKGLGYDLADVGVVVNVSDDHLGIDGLNSLEDLAFVKALVIEAVKPDGYSVLNADDEMTKYLMNRAQGNILLFSRKKKNELIAKHAAAGGKALYIENGTMVIEDGEKCIPLIGIHEIPITFGGMVDCNIENSLAAASALYALGMPIERIRQGLATFKPDLKTNPGRFNMFDMGNFKVMLDYSHNIAGYNAVISFIRRMKAERLVGVIGIPGDRLDRNIEQVGEACGKAFSKIYIKEDRDLRGRKPGEVAEILYQSAVKAGMKKENVEIIHSEIKALETAILDAQPGDLIALFYEEFEPAVELVSKLKEELEKNSITDGIEVNEPVIT
ncbi:MAG: cyanophycin synthetase [Clostridia bacterium]|nr:cyanophycin synthetase [Clostridia bacterium]